MITMAFTLFFLTNPKMTTQVNFPENYRDTLPKKNISKQVTSQKFIPESKIYCCTYCQAKYEILKHGNRITIIYIYKERRNTVHGVVRNGKIYSDDPYEQTFKLSGNLYSLKGNTFLVKNIENGEYYNYILCK